MDEPAAFIEERDAGFICIRRCNHRGVPFAELLGSLGLQPDTDALANVTRQIATDCIAALLWKDMAYGVECMSNERAAHHALEFMERHAPEASRFLVNGRWDLRDDDSGVGVAFTPMTEATFSAVVIVMTSEHITCLLVEDED